MYKSIKRVTAPLGAIALILLTAALSAQAAAPALNPQLDLRPFTPQERVDYALPNAQVGGGLNTVGLGQPFYLDALVNTAVAASNITSVTWTLTSKPGGSAAVLASSPLGTNVPTYKMADRLTLKVAGRSLLRPDVAGQYAVQGVLNSDIYPVLGFVLFSAIFSLVVYLAVDLIYFAIDPRIGH